MTRSIESEEKLEGFINKLESLGYIVQPDRKKPQTFYINGELVNISSRGNQKITADGSRLFWYSIAFSILQEVKWVIYLMTDPDYFVMLPSSFLESLRDLMYPDRKNAGVGVFDIDQDGLAIELQGERKPINEYYHNLIYRDDYPRF